MHYVLVIPYRDRLSQLDGLLPQLQEWLARQHYISSYQILIIEQADTKLFNLGWCINVGFVLACARTTGAWRYVFQPVDCLPLDSSRSDLGTYAGGAHAGNEGYVRLPTPPNAWTNAPFGNYEVPENTAVLLQPSWWRADVWFHWSIYYKAFGVTPDVYRQVNGHSNEYEGWGVEDDDFMLRLGQYPNDIVIERRVLVFDELANTKKEYSPDGNKRAWAEAKGRLKSDGLSNLTFRVISEAPYQGATWICVTRD